MSARVTVGKPITIGAPHPPDPQHLRRPTPHAARRAEPRSPFPACRRAANGNSRKPPLLFVHGGYCDAWCWSPHFLPWFAAKGYAAHALSLRGHGASGGHDTMFVTGLDDFAGRRRTRRRRAFVATGADRPFDGIGDHRAAAGDGPGPRGGVVIAGAADGAPADGRAACRGAARVSAAAVAVRSGAAHRPRARRAAPLLFQRRRRAGNPRRGDESLLQRVAARAPRSFAAAALAGCWRRATCRCSCWGPGTIASQTRMTFARPPSHHGVDATIVPGLAHMLMLERQWEKPAREFGALACGTVNRGEPSAHRASSPRTAPPETARSPRLESACSRNSPGSSGSRAP